MARRTRQAKKTAVTRPKGQKSRFPYIHTYITIVRTIYQVLFWILTIPGVIGIWGVPIAGVIAQQSEAEGAGALALVLPFFGAMVVTVLWFFSYIAVMASIDLLKVFLSIEEKSAFSAHALRMIAAKTSQH